MEAKIHVEYLLSLTLNVIHQWMGLSKKQDKHVTFLFLLTSCVSAAQPGKVFLHSVRSTGGGNTSIPIALPPHASPACAVVVDTGWIV